MYVHSLPAPVPPELRGAALALGNFDGLHAGHRAVIECAADLAKQIGVSTSVATFDPTPREYFAPDAPSHRILTPLRRNKILSSFQVDECFLIPFTREVAEMEPAEFVDRVLVQALGGRAVAVGFDFHFGKARKGDASMLVDLGKARGVAVGVVAEVRDSIGKISSTRARQAIVSGDMKSARVCLGDYWVVDGVVEHGEKRGRTLGFPTANMRPEKMLHPAHAIYAVWARIAGEDSWRPGVANFGRTPTTGLREPLLETVLFDFDGDLYGQCLEVAYVERLRGEEVFDSLEALTSQMKLDAEQARQLLSSADKPLC